MIDRSLIDPSRLLDVLLDDVAGNVNAWIKLVEIVPDYVPPFPRDGEKPGIVVRCLVRPDEPMPGPCVVTGRYSYLRHGGQAGWRSGGYLWDAYGTRWVSIEHAFLAVLHAPVPPPLLKGEVWVVQP